MAVAENTRTEQGQQATTARDFDMGMENRAEAAMYAIRAIARIMRGDIANEGCEEHSGLPSPQVSVYTKAGLIDAIEILAEVVEREIYKERRQHEA